jgi:hypothetical protein
MANFHIYVSDDNQRVIELLIRWKKNKKMSTNLVKMLEDYTDSGERSRHEQIEAKLDNMNRTLLQIQAQLAQSVMVSSIAQDFEDMATDEEVENILNAFSDFGV